MRNNYLVAYQGSVSDIHWRLILDVLRTKLLLKYYHNVTRKLSQDLAVRRKAIKQACDASWWEWDGGSTLLFWRWHKEFWQEAWGSCPVFFAEKQLPQLWGGFTTQ
eukprot:15336014-Ditylum_brightwellii.AAC.1